MFVALLALFIRPPNLDEALRSANLALRDDLANQNDYASFYTSTHEFLQIIKSYGHVPEAELGLGRAYFGAGRYRAAASAYALAGQSKIAVIERRNANRYARITAHFERPQFKNRRVVRQMPWQGSDWLVLTANRKSADEGYGDRAIDGLRVSVFNETSGRLRSRSVALWVIREYAIGATFKRIQLGRSSGFLLHLVYSAGDSSPNSYHVYKRRRDGFRPVGTFFGITESDVLSDGYKTPFEIGVARTWKVYWKDRYRWSGTRFEYVRAGYPHVFGDHWELSADYYPSWLDLACMRAAKRDWTGATKALREAERVCRLSIRVGRRDDGRYHDYGFSGTATINLKEIRQRLKWIAHHDYNHMLLYRPYDWDLQVPPYKLGHAGDVWNGNASG